MRPSITISRRRPPPTTTLFPYTTLFRSNHEPSVAQVLHFLNSPEIQAKLTHAGGYVAKLAKREPEDRKSTRLNSSHRTISYAVFCLKKKSRPRRQSRIERYQSPNDHV